MRNYENFKKRAELIIDYIVREKRTRDDFTYWALCLDDTRTSPREVDTCATSLCVSILQMYEQTATLEKQKITSVIQGGINTLINIRKNDGSWPSVVKPSKISETPSDADVGLIDSFFAMSTLLDVGFLSHDFKLNLVNNKYASLEDRAKFVIDTVNWFLNNKNKDDTGWKNTNSKSENANYIALLATTNTISLLKRIANALTIIDKAKYDEIIIKINNSVKRSINAILLNINADGGIESIIPSDAESQSSLPHTCRLVDILILENDEKNITELQDALNYILKHSSPKQIVSNRNISPDFYSEQYNLNLGEEGEICIQHEHYIECMVLFTLINILIKHRTIKNVCTKLVIDENNLMRSIEDIMNALENAQIKSGKYNGAFKSFIDRAEGKCPVYASYYGYKSIQKYLELYHMFLQTPNTTENDDLIDECSMIEFKFQRAVKRYGLNKQNENEIMQLRTYLKRLQEFKKKLSQQVGDDDRNNILKEIHQMNAYYGENIGDE